MSSIMTPPMMEAADEFPTSPLTEENMNLLLGPDVGEDIDDQDDQDIQMVAEVYYDGGHQQPEREVQEMASPSTSSSSGEPATTSCSTSSPTPARGEPSKNHSSASASPVPTTTGCVETRTPDSNLLSPEIIPKLQPILFDWSAAVENPESVDMEITWQEEKRGYLQTIKELETFKKNVILALGEVTPEGQLAKRRHQSLSPGQQEGAQGNYQDEEHVQDVPADQFDQEERDIQLAQRRSLELPGDKASQSDYLRSQPPPAKKVKNCNSADPSDQSSNRNLSSQGSQDSRPTAGPNRRSTTLKSISRIYSKQESSQYIKGISALLNKVKHSITKFNPEIITELSKGSERNKFQLIQHVGKHMNVMRNEDELLQFLTTRNLLSLSIDYENLVTFPALPNIAPSTRPNLLNIHNFCFNKQQGQYQRNRFVKMVISLCSPKLASCIMVLQGDQLANDLLKNLFSKQSSIWMQVLHYNLLLQATYCFDLSRGRNFFINKVQEIFLPANVTSVQFQQKIYQSREVAWTRADFELHFHSQKVSAPLRDLDNLHLNELQFIKTALSNPRPNLF